MTPERTVWTNTEGGNDHAVTARDGSLSMRVVKPGGDKWESGPIPSKSTPDEWEAAFAGLGSRWNQDPRDDSSDGRHFEATRRAQTAQEEAIWRVCHEQISGNRYNIRDSLEVVLRTKVPEFEEGGLA